MAIDIIGIQLANFKDILLVCPNAILKSFKQQIITQVNIPIKINLPKKVSKKTPKTWRQVDKKKEVAKKRRVGMGKRTKKAEVVTPIEEKKKKAKRDACYHKVKARYDVWPSARASQALVKCRKKGAKNWGKTTTKK